MDSKSFDSHSRPAEVGLGAAPSVAARRSLDERRLAALSIYFENGEPVWDRIDFPVICSRCGYNLRMLTGTRCPECGLDFDWLIVCGAYAHENPLVFEHQWRRRPIRSWIVTMFAVLRPWSFWSKVSMHERIAPSALIAMWLILSLFMAAAQIVAITTGIVLSEYASGRIGDDLPLVLAIEKLAPYWLARLREVLQFAVSGDPAMWFLITLIVGVPLVPFLITWLFILMLRETLGKCRIRNEQVLRVAAYCAPIMSVLCVLGTAGILSAPALITQFLSVGHIILFVAIVVFVPALIFGQIITHALRRYLLLDHASRIGRTCGLILALALWALPMLIVQLGGGF